MMAEQRLPNAGTNASRLLNAVYSLGGRAKAWELLPFIAEQQRTIAAYRALIENLELRNLIVLHDTGEVSITKQAIQLFRNKDRLPQRPQGQVAQSRKSLIVAAKKRPAAPFRPGADEYKKIPSLYGSVRKLPSGEVVE